MTTEESNASLLADLEELHRDIDRKAAALAERHAARLQCRIGCNACCLDELSVTPIEAALIRERHPQLLEEAEPHSKGACAFLDADGACRIYASRPSVCRTQGLPLRVLFEDQDEEIAETRDICPLNLDGGPPLGGLAEEDCWLLGPHELRLLELDERFAEASGAVTSNMDSPRESLRKLFARRA